MLLIIVRMRLGISFLKPVILGDQFAKRALQLVQQLFFGRVSRQGFVDRFHKGLKLVLHCESLFFQTLDARAEAERPARISSPCSSSAGGRRTAGRGLPEIPTGQAKVLVFPPPGSSSGCTHPDA